MPSHVWLFETPWTIYSSPGSSVQGMLQARILDLPNPGMEPRSPALQADSLPPKPQGKPSESTLPNNYILSSYGNVCNIFRGHWTKWAICPDARWANPRWPCSKCACISFLRVDWSLLSLSDFQLLFFIALNRYRPTHPHVLYHHHLIVWAEKPDKERYLLQMYVKYELIGSQWGADSCAQLKCSHRILWDSQPRPTHFALLGLILDGWGLRGSPP